MRDVYILYVLICSRFVGSANIVRPIVAPSPSSWLVSIKYFGKICWLQISNFPDGISHKSLKGALEYQMFKYHY